MSICSLCRSEFSCAMQDQYSDAPCWCTELPKLAIEQMPAATDTGAANCLCPTCLKNWLDSHVNGNKVAQA